MVRPESIRIGSEGGLRGTVLHTSFLGSYVRVAVETPAAEAPVMVALHDAVDVPPVGSTVSLSWTEDTGIALEAAE